MVELLVANVLGLCNGGRFDEFLIRFVRHPSMRAWLVNDTIDDHVNDMNSLGPHVPCERLRQRPHREITGRLASLAEVAGIPLQLAVVPVTPITPLPRSTMPGETALAKANRDDGPVAISRSNS